MTKKERYNQLVEKRKADNICEAYSYRNQSFYKDYDSDEIGNYSMWANDLDADLMIVAQDYCDWETFKKCRGLIQSTVLNEPNELKGWETKTNYYLWQLLKSIDRDIGLPYCPKKRGFS